MQQALKKNNAINNEGLGRSRGGLSSKIHCVADDLGNPVDFILTGGEVHDNLCADVLLDDKNADFVIADKAYDSDRTLEKIAQIGATAVASRHYGGRTTRKKTKELV